MREDTAEMPQRPSIVVLGAVLGAVRALELVTSSQRTRGVRGVAMNRGP